MIEYFIKRVATLFFTLLFASIVIFVSLEIIPGDPASYMLGINAQEDTLLALKKELGLDKPKFERYIYGLRVCWLGILVFHILIDLRLLKWLLNACGYHCL